jgi:hypothetical protein
MLWFFSHRDWGNERAAASKYYWERKGAFYTPDDRPGRHEYISPTPHGYGGRQSATSSTSSPIRNATAIARRMWRAGT